MSEAKIKAIDTIGLQEVAAGTATRVQVLVGPEDGAPNFAMRRFVMGEGGGMPLHTNAVEHEQFVLRGRARMTIGDQVHELRANDVLYNPLHDLGYQSLGDAPLTTPVSEEEHERAGRWRGIERLECGIHGLT